MDERRETQNKIMLTTLYGMGCANNDFYWQEKETPGKREARILKRLKAGKPNHTASIDKKKKRKAVNKSKRRNRK